VRYWFIPENKMKAELYQAPVGDVPTDKKLGLTSLKRS